MLKRLRLLNFRSHKDLSLELEKTTVLVGPNGVGKTNILEAVVFLSFCRSFRDDDKKNLVNYEAEFARITGDELETIIVREPRLSLRVKQNDVPRKISDFIGILPTVIFSPEVISIISGSPMDRRRFLDVMISQTNREYFVDLLNFKKVKSQRNSLLGRINKGEASETELSFWDQEFVTISERISQKRGEAVRFLNGLISSFYKEISGEESNDLKIVYLQNYEGDLAEKIGRERRREVSYGGSIFGSHRDDLVFNLNNFNMANFASRGEVRSAILSLKVSELNFLEKFKQTEEKPMLLLDDIFSEFDPDRRSHLGKLILNYQTLITSTEREHLSSELLKKAKVIDVKGLVNK